MRKLSPSPTATTTPVIRRWRSKKAGGMWSMVWNTRRACRSNSAAAMAAAVTAAAPMTATDVGIVIAVAACSTGSAVVPAATARSGRERCSSSPVAAGSYNRADGASAGGGIATGLADAAPAKVPRREKRTCGGVVQDVGRRRWGKKKNEKKRTTTW